MKRAKEQVKKVRQRLRPAEGGWEVELVLRADVDRQHGAREAQQVWDQECFQLELREIWVAGVCGTVTRAEGLRDCLLGGRPRKFFEDAWRASRAVGRSLQLEAAIHDSLVARRVREMNEAGG
jgi:hypothetical protein